MTLEEPPDNGRPDQTEAGLIMFNATNNQTNNVSIQLSAVSSQLEEEFVNLCDTTRILTSQKERSC